MKIAAAAACLFVQILFCSHLSAQSNREDSLLFQQAIENTVSVYTNQRDDQAAIFNGGHYITTGYIFRTGTPYYLTDSFTKGWVIYDSILFNDVSLLYEDLREMLIFKNSGYLLQLNNERIGSFSIEGHRFTRLVADSANTGISKTGFYEVLYDGRSQVLKEIAKYIKEEPSIYENQIIRHIEENDYYLIKTGLTYKRIRSQAGLIENWNKHQSEIKKFMRKNKLKYRKDKENTLIQVAGYYDQIEK